jgi:4'-phosphopantetheinyl transferase
MNIRRILGRNSIDVWVIKTFEVLNNLDRYSRILSPDEYIRANRFYFKKDRVRFTITHGVLRLLLGSYIGIEPTEIKFYLNEYGKPYLEHRIGIENIQFNISHSRDLILLAFARDLEVGVDIEFVREDLANQEIAERFFSRVEIDDLTSLPKSLQIAAFFACWTRKEAFIKAKGMGLSIPLDSFDVSLGESSSNLLKTTYLDPDEKNQFFIQDMKTLDGYKSAICVKGTGWHTKLLGWNENME